MIAGAAAGLAGAAVNQTTDPIQHVVVIMEENHTFDNYFGDFPGVGSQYALTEPAASNPAPHDIDHSGPRALFAIDGGAMDGFDPLGEVQYKQSDIPVYWAYAQHYGLGENFFTDAASSSTPNHIAMIAAQTGGEDQTIHVHGCLSPANDVVLDRDADGDESYGQPCYNIPSIPQEATTAGLSWKYYGSAPVWDAPQYISGIKNTPGRFLDPDHHRREGQQPAQHQLRHPGRGLPIRSPAAADAAGAELRVLDRQRDHAQLGVELHGDLRHLGRLRWLV